MDKGKALRCSIAGFSLLVLVSAFVLASGFGLSAAPSVRATASSSGDPSWTVDSQTEWQDNTSSSDNTAISSGKLVLDNYTTLENKTVDSFEDDDISEYSGDTANFSIVTSPVYDGSYSLEGTSSGTAQNLDSTTDLNVYPEAGDNFSYRENVDTDSWNGGTKFGFQDSNNYYMIVNSTQDSAIYLKEKVGGSWTTMDSVSVTIPQDEWLKVRVEWATSGDITATVENSTGSTVGTVSGHDENFSSGGIGFSANTAASTAQYAYWDNYKLLNENVQKEYSQGVWKSVVKDFGGRYSVENLELKSTIHGIRRENEPITSSDVFNLENNGENILTEHEFDNDNVHFFEVATSSYTAAAGEWASLGAPSIYKNPDNASVYVLARDRSPSYGGGEYYELYTNDSSDNILDSWSNIFAENMADDTDSVEKASLRYYQDNWYLYFCYMPVGGTWSGGGTISYVTADTVSGLQAKLDNTSTWNQIVDDGVKDSEVMEFNGKYYMWYTEWTGTSWDDADGPLVVSDEPSFSTYTEVADIARAIQDGAGFTPNVGSINYDERSDNFIAVAQWGPSKGNAEWRYFATAENIDGPWRFVENHRLHSYTSSGHGMQYSDYWSLDNQRYYRVQGYDPENDRVSDLYVWDYSNDLAGDISTIPTSVENIYGKIGVDTDDDGAVENYNDNGWTLLDGKDIWSDISIENGYRFQVQFKPESSSPGPTVNSYTLNVSTANIAPTIKSITVDNSLIDRDLDYSGSSAVTATEITVRVRDNDNRSDIAPLRFSLRDNNDSVLVDNVEVTENSVVDENTLDFTYTFNPSDALADDNLGKFDVRSEARDAAGACHVENFLELGHAEFTVDDIDAVASWENLRLENVGVKASARRVTGVAISIDNSWIEDNVEGTFSLGSQPDNSWSKTYNVEENTAHEIYSAVLANDNLDGKSSTKTFTVPLLNTKPAINVDNTSAEMVMDFETGSYDNMDLWFKWRKEGASTWNTTSKANKTGGGSYTHSLTNLSEAENYEFVAFAETFGSPGYVENDVIRTFTTEAAVTVSNVSTDVSTVDRKDDGAGFDVTEEVTVSVELNDASGYKDIKPLRMSIRDNSDAVVVDNIEVTENTVVDENTLKFTYTFNPSNDSKGGSYDIRSEGRDDQGYLDMMDYTDPLANGLFTVDDRETTISAPDSVDRGSTITVKGTASGVATAVSLDNAMVRDSNEGLIPASFEENGDEWQASYKVTGQGGTSQTVRAEILDLGSKLDGSASATYYIKGTGGATPVLPPEKPELRFTVKVGREGGAFQRVENVKAPPKVPLSENAVFKVKVFTDEKPVDNAHVSVSVYDTLDQVNRGADISFLGDGTWKASFDTSELEKTGTYKYRVAVSSSDYEDPQPFQGTFQVSKPVKPKPWWKKKRNLLILGVIASFVLAIIVDEVRRRRR